MNKDVIYIDVEDDVTAIIGKIKKAKEKVIALVPPKRTGALQSAVNLRLLERMAKNDNKKLVLITNNQALIALAASAQIPVAKNLQSKPEIAEIPAIIVDDGDDIIDGSELPVGDHAGTVKVKDGTRASNNNTAKATRNETIDTTDINLEDETTGAAAATVAPAVAKTKKGRPKIPNFDSFRKRLVLGAIGGIGLIALLVWMFGFAPAATVVITASTEPHPVSANVKLGGTAATNFEEGIVSSVSQEEKKDETVEFEATGTGLVGDKASGSVVFKNCEDTAAISIPSGTTISNGSRQYITQSAVSVPGGSGGFFGCTSPGTSAAVAVVAADIGDEYNTSDGTTFSVSGHPNTSVAYMRAVASTDIAGGSSREVTVVSADDIERARGQLLGQSTDEQRAALIAKFTAGEVIVDGSFTVNRGKVTASPKEGEEAKDGKATLSISTTYSIQAVPKAELESYLKASIGSKIDSDTQKIYSTGIEDATLGNFQRDGDDIVATVTAVGNIGPQINENDIKEQVKGKRYGEVQQSLEEQEGIKEVDVQFSYLWVRTVPNNIDKITIEFKVDDE